MDRLMVGREYASHLTETDLRLLAAELDLMDHVPERTGLRQRVPLFDAPALRDFLSDPARRLFLTELLASFTRVASGRYRVRAGGRVRTRRFSELDPVRLAGLLDAVPPAERPGVYRRLGDVTLFLTGVFPDYATTRALGPLDAGRLLRAAGLPSAEQDRVAGTPAMEMLEYLGARWYRSARELAPAATARMVVVGDVAARFQQARRVLNHLADRYLLTDTPWFEPPGSLSGIRVVAKPAHGWSTREPRAGTAIRRTASIKAATAAAIPMTAPSTHTPAHRWLAYSHPPRADPMAPPAK